MVLQRTVFRIFDERSTGYTFVWLRVQHFAIDLPPILKTGIKIDARSQCGAHARWSFRHAVAMGT